MKSLSNEAGRLGRYGIVGLATNGAVYVSFLGMIRAGVKPVLASGICYGLGLSLSYIINRRWTFRSSNEHQRDLPRFIISYSVGLIVTLMSITLLVRVMGPELAQLLTIGIAAMAIYTSLRLLRFGQNE